MFLLALLSASLGPISAFFFASSIDALVRSVSPELATSTAGGGLGFNSLAGPLTEWINEFSNGSSLASVIVFVAFFGLAAALYQGMRFLTRWTAWLIQITSFYQLQRDLYARLLSKPLRFFQESQVGDLMSRAHNDVTAAVSPLSEVLQSLTARLITLVAFVTLMFQTHVALTFVMIGVGLIAALAPALIGRQVRRLQANAQSQLAFISSVVQEAFFAARLVKSSGAESYERDRYWHRAMRHLDVQRRVMFLRLAAEHAAQIIVVINLALLLIVGSIFTAEGAISVAAFAAFLYVARESGVLVAGMANSVVQVYAVLGASERIVELLNEPSAMKDGTIEKAEFDDRIEVRDVSFDYGHGPVLRNVSLTVEKGEFVAFVGPSGSGKSTMADLLLRLHDPTSGQILVDGEDIRSFTMASYRRLFGIVSQETVLFNEPVRTNIAYGARDQSQERVEEAARIANADEFIRQLPGGYDTVIGDRGIKLSGGERQRIAIARAMASQPQILVFDEATSSLDNRSERRVQEAIDRVVGSTTAIVIAHRLSTVARADRIYVFNNGEVIEVGTHEELSSRGGVYADLLRLQFTETAAVAVDGDE